jgi:3-methyl-2-oxobutanoate hydroxymethyltransferase
MKKSILDFQGMKKSELVGGSMGMGVYKYAGGTLPVTMDQCIVHCDAVRRGAPNTFVMGGMPSLSYQTSPSEAI